MKTAKENRTKRYSNLSNQMSSQKRESAEPRISPEQVVQAFQSFGYEPNQNGMNDVGYWATRPQSEGPKLMEELRKRRLEENSKKDEEKTKQQIEMERRNRAAPLEGKKILEVYSEFGFPEPDVDWVRQNLPNDEDKLRHILETQRKLMDKGFKKQGDALVNTIQVQPAQSATQSAPLVTPRQNIGGTGGQGGIPDGMGGIAPARSKAFFVGDHGLIRFVDQPNHVWLVNAKAKTLRPFASEKDFEDYFEDSEGAKKAIVSNLTTSSLGKNGVLTGYSLQTIKNAVKPGAEDGQGGEPDISALGQRYGKPANDQQEQKAWMVLDNILKSLSSPESGIDPELLNKAKNDPNKVAFLINALAYGDYTPNDIIADLKSGASQPMEGQPQGQAPSPSDGRGGIPDGQGGSYPTSSLEPGATGAAVKQLQDYLVSQGYMTQAQVNTGYGTYGPQTTAAVAKLQQAKGVDTAGYPGYWGPRTLAVLGGTPSNPVAGANSGTPIDPVKPKETTSTTTTSTSSSSSSTSGLPGGDNFNNLPISKMPDSLTASSNSVSVDSQEFKDRMAKVNTAMYDIAMQQVNAVTEQQKALADSNWKTFKDNIEKTYGWKLADNASQAYDQVKQLSESYSGRGLLNSGIQNESVDDYLKGIRKQDARNREALTSEEDVKLKERMLATGSSADIQKMNEEDQAKGLPREQWRSVQWGLAPSTGIQDQFSIANLMAKYPQLSTEDAQRYRDSVIDENGNYRSTLYQKQYEAINGSLTGTHKVQTGIDSSGNPIYSEELGGQGLEAAKSDYASRKATEELAKEREAATKESTITTDPNDYNYFSSPSSGTNSTPQTNTNIQTQAQYTAPASTTATPSTPAVGSAAYNAQLKEIQAGIDKVKAGLASYTTTNSTPKTTTTSTTPKTSTYSGSSIVDYLSSVGKANDYNSRAALAKQYNINNYTGSASQNTQLLTKLRGY
jgi:hypothetical protein